MLKEGLRWKIGDGSQISVLKELWLRAGKIIQFEPVRLDVVSSMTVRDLFLLGLKSWNMNLLNALFQHECC